MLALGLATATGCGGGDSVAEDGPGAGEDTMSETTTTDPSPSVTTSGPTDTFTKVRVIGTVTLNGSCVDVMSDNGVTWTLLGEEAAVLEEGQRVSVTGMPRPDSPDCAGAPLVIWKLTVLM